MCCTRAGLQAQLALPEKITKEDIAKHVAIVNTLAKVPKKSWCYQPGADETVGAGTLAGGGAAAGTGAGGSDFATNPFMPAGPLLQAELECKLVIASSCVAF